MEHPTGKNPKKVILVGLGPSKSEYMNIMGSSSHAIEHDEVWGVNGAGAVIKVDCSFAMDDYLTCVNRTPNFAKWFEEAEEPFFTSMPRNPKALEYPLAEVLDMPGARPYFNGSVSYVAAYAALIGVEELTIFGCDYLYGGIGQMPPRQTETVARYYACMSFWLGFCSARGMNAVICPSSPLLDADLLVLEQFYGYVIKPHYESNPPTHLGGSFARCHIDQGALDFVAEKFDVKTMVDVGCGTGDMVIAAKERGIQAVGIDGDVHAQRRVKVYIHDYTTAPLQVQDSDLGWSVEFLEHVKEEYMPNYMETFKSCKRLVITAAPPGTPGHHHVNLQDQAYWVEKFKEYGFTLDEATTTAVREVSTMGRDFMRDTGMVFERAA